MQNCLLKMVFMLSRGDRKCHLMQQIQILTLNPWNLAKEFSIRQENAGFFI